MCINNIYTYNTKYMYVHKHDITNSSLMYMYDYSISNYY